ncbi:MAG: MSMEG_4193 family putative phosphomutase [Nocardioidaceae bacterium]|nr:MSMEG_4193 family putative phosphomutase [Nocardioidaceae bacterium]
MAVLILLRHGRTNANASGLLAGRTPGVRLDDVGSEQAERAAARLSTVPLAAVVTSPQERCRQTAAAVLRAQRAAGHPAQRAMTDRGIAECDYGDWQGQKIQALIKEPLWRTVQQQPSAVTFPGGESMSTMQHRAVSALRRRDAVLSQTHGPNAVWVAASHGDIIKSVLADALGMHLDHFQRIHVDPASISIVRYAEGRPYLLASNTHDGDLSWLATTPEKARTGHQDAVPTIGGGSGPGTR